MSGTARTARSARRQTARARKSRAARSLPPGRTKLFSSGSVAFASSISCSSRSTASSVIRRRPRLRRERNGEVGAEVEELVLDPVEAARPADERVELVDVAHRGDARVELRDPRAVAEARLPLVPAARVDARQADGLVAVPHPRSLRRMIQARDRRRRRGDRRDLRAVVRAARLPAGAAHARGAPPVVLRPLAEPRAGCGTRLGSRLRDARRGLADAPLRPPGRDRHAASATRCSSTSRTLRPDGFQFWVFQQNERARRFYEAHGAVAVEFTDGEHNEEKTPDVRYEWKPSA